MPMRQPSLRVRAGLALGVVLVLGACTPGGQFDPTEMLSTDIFETKKKLQGDREPVFPQGVPGAETGVPPDLVKGYQPPPEPPAVQSTEASKPAAKPAATAAVKPKPKPKPQVARAPAATPAQGSPTSATPAHDPVWDQKGAAPPPPAQSPWPATPASQPAQTNWPTPPSAAPAPPASSAQTNWPAPPTSAH
jgi:hypothetical protein